MKNVKERPIVFTGPMVRSILEGQKTVMRSPIKDQPPTGHKWRGWVVDSTNTKIVGKASWGESDGPLLHQSVYARCPYGKPGDRLWVRETFALYGDQKMYAIHFLADRPHHVGQKGMGYKSPISMPRWASRILLEVTSIRVERLQDRTDGSLWAEGFATFGDGERDWDSRYEAQGHGVAANPWTWVVEFKRVTR